LLGISKGAVLLAARGRVSCTPRGRYLKGLNTKREGSSKR